MCFIDENLVKKQEIDLRAKIDAEILETSTD